jgi:hypothetical protein
MNFFDYTGAPNLLQPEVAETDNRDAFHEGIRVPVIRIRPTRRRTPLNER